MVKKVKVQHFMANGESTFTETWTLKTPLTGTFKVDKRRLTLMVRKDAHKPHEKYTTTHYVVSWGDGTDAFILENK